MGGAIAEKLLSELGISFTAYVRSIGPVTIDYDKFDKAEIMNNKLFMPDSEAAAKAESYLEGLMSEKDSSGAEVECIISGVPAGIGEPVFDKLDARLAGAVMSIGAVKAVEIGDGKKVAEMRGSENNDPFKMKDGEVTKLTNHAGGILGGMSDGSDIVLRASFKPTPSIFRKQETVSKQGEDVEIEIKGRHDPIIAPRATVVVEAMAALSIADLLLTGCTSRVENVLKIFGKN